MYVPGGMGAVSASIGAAAKERGAEIVTNATVKKILYEGQKAIGVEMEDGTKHVKLRLHAVEGVCIHG